MNKETFNIKHPKLNTKLMISPIRDSPLRTIMLGLSKHMLHRTNLLRRVT